MRDLLPRIRRCWWIVALSVALGLAGAVGLTLTTHPVYVSTAKVYFSIRTQTDSTSLVQGSQFAQQQIASYVQVTTSQLVLRPVIARLNLEGTPGDLAGQVTATSPEGTSLLQVTVKGSDGRQTALVVNAVADELIRAVGTLEQPTTVSSSPVQGTIIERGVASSTPVGPKPAYNLGLGLLLGLLLGAVGSIARESWDNRVRNRPELTDDIGIPVLGALTDAPRMYSASAQIELPRQAAFDDFRRIRNNLQPRLDRAGGSSVVVTSSAVGEGKSTLVTGLATAFAEDGLSVVVVDGDLRTAALSRRLAPHIATGLSHVLEQRELEPFAAVAQVGTFDVLVAGDVSSNASPLLSARLLTPVIEQLQAKYDVVLVDAPSVAASSDAARLSHLAAMTVLVANTHSTTLPAIRAAISAIHSAGGHVIGAVVNGHRD